LFVNNRRTGGRFPSKRYKEWQEEAARALKDQAAVPAFKGPVELSFQFGRPDKRKRDLMNLIKAPEDFLVRHGFIEDDSLVQKVSAEWTADTNGVLIGIARA